MRQTSTWRGVIARKRALAAPEVAREGSTPKVSYSYSFFLNSGGTARNHNRLTGITYPTGRSLSYGYNSGVDDEISRLSYIADSAYPGFSEAYTYLGLDTLATRTRPLSSYALVLSYAIWGGSSDGGDQYTGLDRFGRIVEQQWRYTATGIAIDDTLYRYDRDNNLLSRSNIFLEQYRYDGLNQLISFSQGSHSQSWSLDAVGNWTSFTTDGSTQSRSFNSQNQLTAISGASTPTYDANGNTTGDEQGTRSTYDAWNRLVSGVTSAGSSVVYAYDALGRRVRMGTSPSTGFPYSYIDLYFSSSWQVLAELGPSYRQYVWSPLYVDALARLSLDLTKSYGVQQDANWNVTSLTEAVNDPYTNTYSIRVHERVLYDPYGKPTLSGLNLNMPYLFQGGRYDATTGLYHFRHRVETSQILDGVPTLQANLESSRRELAELNAAQEHLVNERRRLLETGNPTTACEKKLSATVGPIGVVLSRIAELEKMVPSRIALAGSQIDELQRALMQELYDGQQRDRTDLEAAFFQASGAIIRKLMRVHKLAASRGNDLQRFRRQMESGRAATIVQEFQSAPAPAEPAAATT